MKRTAKHRGEKNTLRPEYDFSGGVRGKYVKRYRQGTNVVVLDPDVAMAFRTSEAVNKALRAVLEARRPRGKRAGSSRSAVRP